MSSIKGTPPMVVTTEREGNIVTLKVEHHDHQSFSRAVDPRATRGMHSYMVAHGLRDVALVEVKYAVEEPAPRRCISVYTYEVRG